MPPFATFGGGGYGDQNAVNNNPEQLGTNRILPCRLLACYTYIALAARDAQSVQVSE